MSIEKQPLDLATRNLLVTLRCGGVVETKSD